MLLMPRKSVPDAKQDAFENMFGQRRTVVKQLSDRQRPVLQSNTPGDPYTIHPRMLCSVRTMCIALLHEYMYACACPTSIPSVREQKTLAVAGACGHVNAYGLLGGCAHARTKERKTQRETWSAKVRERKRER